MWSIVLPCTRFDGGFSSARNACLSVLTLKDLVSRPQAVLAKNRHLNSLAPLPLRRTRLGFTSASSFSSILVVLYATFSWLHFVPSYFRLYPSLARSVFENAGKRYSFVSCFRSGVPVIMFAKRNGQTKWPNEMAN